MKKSSLKRREFTREFKLKVLAEIAASQTMAQVARRYQFNPNLLTQWRKQLSKYKEQAFAGRGRAYSEEARVAELERLVGRLTLENDLLKKALQRLAGRV